MAAVAVDQGFWFALLGGASDGGFGLSEFVNRPVQGEQEFFGAIDFESSVELMREFNDCSGVAEAFFRELDSLAAEGDGVIGSDGSLVTEAEAALQVEASWQAPEVVFGLFGRDSETAIEVLDEAIEDEIGLLAGGGAGEAQFAGEAVLKGSPETFYLSKSQQNPPNLLLELVRPSMGQPTARVFRRKGQSPSSSR